MSRLFTFDNMLKAGQAGEDYIQSMFPNWRRSSGFKEDFVTDKEELVELKTESRTCEETPNLALELHSSGTGKGAVERAAEQSDIIIYLFRCGTMFLYDSKSLWHFLNTNKNRYRNVKIKNKGYETTVVLVPRVDVEGCKYVSSIN